MRLFFYPTFANEEQLNDQVNRAVWYLESLLPKCINFYSNTNFVFKEESHFSHLLSKSYKNMLGAGRIKFHGAELAQQADLTVGDVIIQWKENDSLLSSERKILQDWASSGAKVYDVNKTRRMEGSLYIEVSRDFYSADTNFLKVNIKKFAKLVEKYKEFNNSFLFCTGPSISNYTNYRYESGVKIICNSVINDDDFMDAVKPDILTFADPIFHFGCSSYAQAFRDKLKEVANKYDFDIVIPIKYYPLFCYAMPELVNRVVALPYEEKNDFVIDLSEAFSTKTTDNVLSFMMLPLATTLGDNVYIMGCDGRPLDDDDYFWQHNNKTQFTGEMESIKHAHPSFFKLEYNKY